MTEVKCFGVWEHDGRGLVFLPFLGRCYALPSVGNPPDQDQPEGASCPIGLRFSSLKIALGGTPSSAAKWAGKPAPVHRAWHAAQHLPADMHCTHGEALLREC